MVVSFACFLCFKPVGYFKITFSGFPQSYEAQIPIFPAKNFGTICAAHLKTPALRYLTGEAPLPGLYMLLWKGHLEICFREAVLTWVSIPSFPQN